MSRQSHSITVIVDIPPHVPKDKVISTLHDHSGIMTLQPLVTASRPVQPNENISSTESAHFSGTSPQDLAHYEIDETVTIIPGIKKNLTFPGRWQDTPNGCKCWVNVPQGITVASEWAVRPKEGESASWVLEEKATVECSIFLMPFVRRSFKSTHTEMSKKIVDKAARVKEGDKQDVPAGK